MRRFGDNFFIRSDYQEKSDDKYDCLKNCLFLMKQAIFLAERQVCGWEYRADAAQYTKKRAAFTALL